MKKSKILSLLLIFSMLLGGTNLANIYADNLPQEPQTPQTNEPQAPQTNEPQTGSTPTLSDPSPANWLTTTQISKDSVVIYDSSKSPTTTPILNSGDNIIYKFNMKLVQNRTANINDTFPIKIQESFFDSSNGGNGDGGDLTLNGATYPADGSNIFSATSLTNPAIEDINNVKYYCYYLTFDPKNANVNSNLTSLSNFQMEISLVVGNTITTSNDFVPIISDDTTTVTINYMPTPVVPSGGTPITSKKVDAVYDETGKYIGTGANVVVKDGYKVQFLITVKDASTDKTATVTKIYEILPKGYDFGAPITGVGWIESSPQINPETGKAPANGETIYELVESNLDPHAGYGKLPQELYPKDTAGKVTEMTVPFSAIVRDSNTGNGRKPWSTDDLHNLAASDGDKGSGVNPNYGGSTKYDSSIVESLDLNTKALADSTPNFKVSAKNDSTAPIKNIKIMAYVPVGLTYDKTKNGSPWRFIKKIKTGNGLWSSSLDVYEIDSTDTVPVGMSYSADLYLTVKNDVDASGKTIFNPTDYYMATKVKSYQNSDGVSTDPAENGVGVAAILDEESFPGDDPFASLISNVDKTTLYPIESGTKEKHGVVNENSKSATILQDDDNFDFTNVVVDHSGDSGGNNAMIMKERLIDGNSDSVPQELENGKIVNSPPIDSNKIFTQIVDKANKDKYFTSYSPIDKDGNITNYNNYMIYEIWVNKDGLQSTVIPVDKNNDGTITLDELQGTSFTDLLPAGLKLVSYDNASSVGPNGADHIGAKTYAVQVERYASVIPGAKINYSNSTDYIYQNLGISSFHLNPYPLDTLGTKTLTDNNQLGIENNECGGTYFGVSMNVNNNAGNNQDQQLLTLSFNQGMDGGKNVLGDYIAHPLSSKAAYRIRMVVTIDPKSFDENTTYTNTANYKYGSVVSTATETTSSHWDKSAASASFQKFVLDQNNKWIDSSSINIMNPSDLTVNYKIRVRSQKGMTANELQRIDYIDDSTGMVESVSSPTISESYSPSNGKNGIEQATGEWSDNQPMTYDGKVTAVIDPTCSTNILIDNPSGIADLRQYDVEYTVKYKMAVIGNATGLFPGKKVINTVASSSVNSLVPINISVFKFDAANVKAVPKNYVFNVYYPTVAGGTIADLKNPVLDNKGIPIALSDATNGKLSFDFAPTPEEYMKNDSWNIILRETKAPDGYKGKDSDYPLTILKDANSGNLSLKHFDSPINGSVTGTTYVIPVILNDPFNTSDVKVNDESKSPTPSPTSGPGPGPGPTSSSSTSSPAPVPTSTPMPFTPNITPSGYNYKDDGNNVFTITKDGTPLGTVTVPAGKTIEDINIADNIIPFGVPKANPKTGDSQTNKGLINLAFIFSIMIFQVIYFVVKKKRNKKIQ